jgi:hypothetical protein
LGKSTQLLSGWSARHAWVQRCAEWDRFLEDQAVGAAVDEVREMARRHAQLADLLVGMVHQRAASIVANGQVDAIPVEQVPRWAHVGVMIGRLSRGAASGILAGESPAAMEASGRSLAELFQPAGPGETSVTELELARIVVERSRAGRPDGEEDLDGLDLALAELVAQDPDGGDDDGHDDPAELRPAAAEVPELVAQPEPDPEPAEVVPADPEAEIAAGWAWLREHPRRPAPGADLVEWFRVRRLVGLDPVPSDRPRPRRYRRRAS